VKSCQKPVAAAALLAGLLLGAPASASAQSCVTRLPVKTTIPSPFALSYKRTVPITVTSRGPALWRSLRVQIYTFTGVKLGEGMTRFRAKQTATVKVRLRFRMQAGRYTLVVTGEPNASQSCGPKQLTRAIRFRGCMEKLPLQFPNPPGGLAADHDGSLPVNVRSKDGTVMRNLEASLYSFAGDTFGRRKLSILFGEAMINIPLDQPLQPGSYSLVVEGTIDQPDVCGPKEAKTVLTFG